MNIKRINKKNQPLELVDLKVYPLLTLIYI